MMKLLFIIILGYVAWSYFNDNHVTTAQEQITHKESSNYVTSKIVTPTFKENSNYVAPIIVTPTFSCDGRQHCSQMSSYKEAVFFINNCPNTKMDGDNDGKPCERQFGH